MEGSTLDVVKFWDIFDGLARFEGSGRVGIFLASTLPYIFI
jgi:hypothetical protein